MRLRTFLPAGILFIAMYASHFAYGQGYARQETVARQVMEFFNAKDYEALQKLFSPEMDKAMPLDKSKQFLQLLLAQEGRMERLSGPTGTGSAAVFQAFFEHGSLDMTISLDALGKIDGLWFRQPAPKVAAPARNSTPLYLPIEGTWLVFWGGDSGDINQHHEVPNQKFAFDLIGIGPDGQTHRGQGTRNEDYYAYGRKILAPADGVVIEVIDGVRDNAPGSMNPYSALGNCVVLQHKPNEVSVLAHFQPRTIRVKPGDKVKRGAFLGRCGNSGNSSEPHLHYHLQSSAIIQDGLGIKCFFENVNVSQKGKTELRRDYSPVKGEVVSPE
jgi:murein DD-endopeptidase MepM/ murein hydrolase activator NlpD